MALDIRWRYDVSALPIDEYTRVSIDKRGTGVSVADQHEDNLDSAEEMGTELGEWFDDGDRRATLGAKARPRWEAFLEKMRQGRSGGLRVWDVSRAARDLGIGFELVRIVRDYGLKGFRVISSSTNQVWVLSDEMDANGFQEELVKAERHALVIQATTRRAMRRKARRGELTGGTRRRFGFIDAYNNVHHLAEAELIREADRRIRKDGQVKFVVNDWAERGIVTPKIMNDAGTKVVFEGGRQFDETRLKQVLMRPINAGYARMSEDGKLSGRLPGDPILAEADFLELCQVLTSQKRGRPLAHDFLVTGPNVRLLRCVPCQSWMSGNRNGTGVTKERQAKGVKVRPYYKCTHNPNGYKRRGCFQTIDMRQTDAMLTKAAYAWWTDPARLERDIVIPADSARGRELDEELALLRQRHTRLILSTAPGVEASLMDLEARIAALTAERDTLMSPTVIQGSTLEAINARWNEGAESRRLMVREAFRLIEVHPAEDDGPYRFLQNRINVTFADAPLDPR